MLQNKQIIQYKQFVTYEKLSKSKQMFTLNMLRVLHPSSAVQHTVRQIVALSKKHFKDIFKR